jgi:hypothetical protein
MTEKDITFIISKGRSGSTLLQTVLDAHPNIIAPFESRYFLHLKAKYGKVVQWNDKKILSFLSDLEQEGKFHFFWSVNREQLKSYFLSLPRNKPFSFYCMAVLKQHESFFSKKEPKAMIDKNPIHAMFLEDLIYHFPKAKFIHLIRDYRANALSHFKVLPNESIEWHTYKWLRINQEIEKHKAIHPSKFITLRYEDLIDNPEKELRNICAYIGVNFHDNLLSHHNHINQSHFEKLLNHSKYKKIRQKLILKYHKNITTPINPSINEKWKTEISQQELLSIEAIGNLLGEGFSYNPSASIDASRLKNMKNLERKFNIWEKKLRLFYQLPIWLRELISGKYPQIKKHLN